MHPRKVLFDPSRYFRSDAKEKFSHQVSDNESAPGGEKGRGCQCENKTKWSQKIYTAKAEEEELKEKEGTDTGQAE